MFRVDVIADSSNKWVGNLLRFKTADDAEEYAENLAARWTAIRQWRVIEDGKALPETSTEIRS